MSLQRVEKIRCYAKPCKSHFQLLSSKVLSQFPTVPRSFHSETLIQKNNSILPRNGVYPNRTLYIEPLCQSFDLSFASRFSPFDTFKNRKNDRKAPTSASVPQQQTPCKKCAKIRSSVKKFFQAKFETNNADAKTSLTEQANPIRMHIFRDEGSQYGATVTKSHNDPQTAISDSHPIANATVCFGCDQPEREAPTRGQPIVSPVCYNGQVGASPLGEIFKSLPERIKKVVKIDRPHSLGQRKRMTDKEQTRETSVHETRKPGGR